MREMQPSKELGALSRSLMSGINRRQFVTLSASALCSLGAYLW